MVRRLLPLPPLLAALAADGAGAHRLAFYVLLLAVPAGVVAGLQRFAAALDGEGELWQAAVSALALVLVVLSAAARGPDLAENAAPALAVSSLAAALALVALPALRALVPLPLRPVPRRPL